MKTTIPKDYDGVYHADGMQTIYATKKPKTKKEFENAILSWFKEEFPKRKIVSFVMIETPHFERVKGYSPEMEGRYDIYYIDTAQKHGYKNMVFACKHVLSGKRPPQKPICYRDGVYACKECRDMKQKGIMPDIKVVHSECLVDLGILTR